MDCSFVIAVMTSNNKIRIVLVDDHKLIRETWRFLLEQEGVFEVLAECEGGDEAVRIARQLKPDIMLMDVNMQPVNGFEATRRIHKELPEIRIIGMSINNQPSYARNMLQLGARGYVTKNSTREEMVEAIREVHGGAEYICREILEKMKSETT